MSYPGNGELSREIQERVISTFEHTLQLVGQSSRDEALLGCDFILRLDPLFEPARVLQERLRRTDGPVHDLEVDDLASATQGVLEDAAVVAEPGEPGDSEPGVPSVEELQDTLARLLDHRQLEEAMELASRYPETVANDPLLQHTVTTVQSRLEATPYVESFLDASKAALDEGDETRAEAQLDKARSLDPTHPRIGALERRLATGIVGGLQDGLEGDDSFAGLNEELSSAAGARQDAGVLGIDFGKELGDDLGSFSFDALDADERAVGAPDDDPDRRIEDLLAEGEQAFERKDYQAAIDAWSRIFLIDIDHGEANRRIELARKLKAEDDRALEEILHDGFASLESGDVQAARSHFAQVLAREPDHLEAREALQKLEAGPEGAAAGQGGARPVRPASPRSEVRAETPAAARASAAPRPVQAPKRSPSTRFLGIGGLVLLVAVAGAWYLVTHWDRMFPNSSPQPAVAARVPNPIERARGLHDEGKIQEAIALLRRLPPASPDYAEAQALVAQWESTPAPEAGEGAATPEEEMARREELVAEARRARASGHLIEALGLLEQATAIAPLSGEAAALLEDVEEKIAPLRPQLELFRAGDWEYALPDLWLLYDAAPGNQDVRRLIVDSYYNLGVRDLQRGYPAAAAKKFEEALALAPDDEPLARLRGFAETYEQRSEDLLYRIFVKYLPFRP